MILGSPRNRLLVAAILLTGCQATANDGIALVGATLIDGTGGQALTDAVVVVRRGRIESVGQRAGFALPRRTREVDVSGRWIIPGLIDAHAHLGPVYSWARPRYLAWGVTTVRDVHSGIGLLPALHRKPDAGAPFGPRVYAAGAMIDGLPTTYSDAIGINDEKEARKGVDRLVTAVQKTVVKMSDRAVALVAQTRISPTARAALEDALSR